VIKERVRRVPAPGSIWIGALCRAGFEDDVEAELQHWAEPRGAQTKVLHCAPGVVLIELAAAMPSLAASKALQFPALDDLVFVRDLMRVSVELADLDTRDRFGPIEAELDAQGRWRQVQILAPDSDAAKPLAPLLRALDSRVQGRVDPTANVLARVWLVSGTHALIGHVAAAAAAIFPGGIPRLRFPPEAPSRSTLKLDEAFQVLLSERERERLLRAGMRAVDLGSAPGGWTYQLVRRHIRVIAVDNGRMDAALLQSGLVEHLRDDGFRYLPKKPVDWLVCDMVEKPSRVVDLVLRWFLNGHCRVAIFNLKLPMKKRFAAWEQAQTALGALANHGFSVRARQLYHDREEITVAIVPGEKVKSSQTPLAKVNVHRAPAGRIARRQR